MFGFHYETVEAGVISSTPSRLSVSAALVKSGFCPEGILYEVLK